MLGRLGKNEITTFMLVIVDKRSSRKINHVLSLNNNLQCNLSISWVVHRERQNRPKCERNLKTRVCYSSFNWKFSYRWIQDNFIPPQKKTRVWRNEINPVKCEVGRFKQSFLVLTGRQSDQPSRIHTFVISKVLILYNLFFPVMPQR